MPAKRLHNQTKNVMLSFKITADEKKKLTEYCKKTKQTFSDVLRSKLQKILAD
jgi:hypothetical protein